MSEELTPQELWAEQEAKQLERLADSVEKLLPGWEIQRHPGGYLRCLEISCKAQAYREIALQLRQPYWIRLEQEDYKKHEGRS